MADFKYNNRDEVPGVVYELDYQQAIDSLAAMKQALLNAGDESGAWAADMAIRKIRVNGSRFIENAGNMFVREAMKKERSLVGGKPSGYVPTTNLEQHIEKEVTENGHKVTIEPLARSKDGYYYGAAVEFGLKSNKNYPKQPFMKPTAESLSDDIQEESRKALQQSADVGGI